MKKIIFVILAVFSTNLLATEKLEKLVLAGSVAYVSHPMAYIIENNKLADVAKKVEFVLWNNPDELRALTLHNKADFIAFPINVGANLFNKGVKLKLLNVSVWGLFGLVSYDKNLNSLQDFKGKDLVVPFRADMPDIVLQTLLKKHGIDSKKDINIKYIANPIDAMQNIIIGREKNALLVEPGMSMALMKAKGLNRSVDLQKEWGKVFGTNGDIPQAGVAEVGNHSQKVVARFVEEYEKAMQWYIENPKQAGELAQKHFKVFKAKAIEKSIPFVRLKSRTAQESKQDLQAFFKILLQENPKLIGNKLPSDDFYYK